MSTAIIAAIAIGTSLGTGPHTDSISSSQATIPAVIQAMVCRGRPSK